MFLLCCHCHCSAAKIPWYIGLRWQHLTVLSRIVSEIISSLRNAILFNWYVNHCYIKGGIYETGYRKHSTANKLYTEYGLCCLQFYDFVQADHYNDIIMIHDIWNHRQFHCLFEGIFICTTKKTSKRHVTGPLWSASNEEIISMSSGHHVYELMVNSQLLLFHAIVSAKHLCQHLCQQLHFIW